MPRVPVVHVLTGPADGTDRRRRAIEADALILAVGAHDTMLPFPGWELPGVVTAGAAQALVKGERVAIGDRVVVAGTGPFLLPVAATLLGAGRVVATGRDDDQLRELRELGADTVINTAVPDDDLLRAYRDAMGDGYHVIADYLWGRPTDVLLRALVPDTFALGRRTRLIQIGEVAGATVTMPAASLRTSGLEIVGAATGIDGESIARMYEQVLSWIRTGELDVEVETVPLRDIETAWQRTDLRGKRLVGTP